MDIGISRFCFWKVRELFRHAGLLEITGLKVRNGIRLDPLTEYRIQLIHGCVADSVLQVYVALHGAAEFGLIHEKSRQGGVGSSRDQVLLQERRFGNLDLLGIESILQEQS